MSKLTQIKLALSKLLSNFSTEGKLTWTEEGPIEVGYEVYTEDSEGNYIPAEDGEYTLGEKTVKVEGGTVVSIDAPTELSIVLPTDTPVVEPEPTFEVVPEQAPVVEEPSGIIINEVAPAAPVIAAPVIEEPVVEEVPAEETPVEQLIEEPVNPIVEVRSQVTELAGVVSMLSDKMAIIERETALTKEALEKMSKMSVAMSAQIELEKGVVSRTGNPKLDAHLQEMFR